MKFLKSLKLILVIISLVFLFACDGGGGASGDSGSTGGSADTTAPAKVSVTGITAGETSITVSWIDPPDSDLERIEVSYTGGTDFDVAKGDGTTTIGSLTANTEYTINIYSVDDSGNTSEAEKLTLSTSSSGTADIEIIKTAAELAAVEPNKNYILLSDIDLSGYSSGEGWVPIGSLAEPFCGSFNGNGYEITNLYINRGSEDYQGLFGVFAPVSKNMIKNVVIENASVTGKDYCGALAGYTSGSGTCEISKCSTSGSVSGSKYVGGLIGSNEQGDISNSHSEASVQGSVDFTGGLIGSSSGGSIFKSYSTGSVSGYSNCGGFVGYIAIACNIDKCYSTGSVSGINSCGGFIGYCNSSTISNSYSMGNSNVTGVYSGGFSGRAYNSTYNNCYSTGIAAVGSSNVGGFLAYDISGISASSNCFWDTVNSGLSSSVLGTGKTTSEMKIQATFTGWDFAGETVNGTDDIWSIDPLINDGYPYLTGMEP